MYYGKAGSLNILGIVKNLSMGRKVVFVSGIKESCLSDRQTTVCPKINVLNLLKYVPREFLNFVKTERFLLLFVRALFFNETLRKSA